MSQWARSHPHLVGGPSDPWMRDPRYVAAMRDVERDCEGCGRFTRLNVEGLCRDCERDGW